MEDNDVCTPWYDNRNRQFPDNQIALYSSYRFKNVEAHIVMHFFSEWRNKEDLAGSFSFELLFSRLRPI